MTKKKILRGEIWTVDLRPGIGHEITKIRPALIISKNDINRFSPMIIVVPISSQIPPLMGPDRVLIPKKDLKLAKNSVVLCGQVRSIDKSRIKKKVDAIPQEKLLEVEEALRLVLGLD